MYPVILDPPSFSGGDHSKSADDLVQSVTLGNGGPGGAGKNQYALVFLTFPWHSLAGGWVENGFKAYQWDL